MRAEGGASGALHVVRRAEATYIGGMCRRWSCDHSMAVHEMSARVELNGESGGPCGECDCPGFVALYHG